MLNPLTDKEKWISIRLCEMLQLIFLIDSSECSSKFNGFQCTRFEMLLDWNGLYNDFLRGRKNDFQNVASAVYIDQWLIIIKMHTKRWARHSIGCNWVSQKFNTFKISRLSSLRFWLKRENSSISAIKLRLIDCTWWKNRLIWTTRYNLMKNCALLVDVSY